MAFGGQSAFLRSRLCAMRPTQQTSIQRRLLEVEAQLFHELAVLTPTRLSTNFLEPYPWRTKYWFLSLHLLASRSCLFCGVSSGVSVSVEAVDKFWHERVATYESGCGDLLCHSKARGATILVHGVVGRGSFVSLLL